MNKAEILQAILALHEAVNSGNKERMCQCAYLLDALFRNEVPDPLSGFESALMRFKMAEAMIAFLVAIGDKSQAGTLRNRITAHYQAIRKSKDYSVAQKRELKDILGRIKKKMPPVPRNSNHLY